MMMLLLLLLVPIVVAVVATECDGVVILLLLLLLVSIVVVIMMMVLLLLLIFQVCCVLNQAAVDLTIVLCLVGVSYISTVATWQWLDRPQNLNLDNFVHPTLLASFRKDPVTHWCLQSGV